jgi:Kef-type K+ transport system membrane component KefB
VGITARVFRDIGRLQDPEARIILGAAVIDDVLGLIILAIVSAIVSVGEVSLMEVGLITGKAVIFLVAAVVAGQYFMDLLGKFFSRANVGMGVKFSIAISFGLLLAFLAEMIDLAPIVGAFAAGLILDPHQFRHFFENPEMVDDIHSCIEQSDTGLKSRVQKVMNDEESVSIRKCLEQTNPDIQHRFWEIIDYTDAELEKRVREVTGRYSVRHIEEVIEPISLFLVPIFFVKVGMDVRLDTLFDLHIVLVALGITIAAIAGKIVSGFAAGNVRKLVVGWGMVPRGEVGLIFAATGRALGVVSDEVYSVIVIMVIFSTLLPPPILSSMLKKEQREKGEEPRKAPAPSPEARGEARPEPGAPEPARPVRSVDELVQVAAQREEAEQEVTDEALTRQGIEERILRGEGKGLNLKDAYLGGLDLSYLNLSGANLSGANLENANLSGANLENANLESANLRRARLKRTNLHHTNVQDADLSGADLESAEVVDADLRGASLDEANLRWVNLHGSRLQGASLQEVRFNRRTTWPAGFELLPAGRE